MPQRVSEISAFTNLDIACMHALRELGWHDGTLADPKLHQDGQEFAHYVEKYLRRPKARGAYRLVRVAHVPMRPTR